MDTLDYLRTHIVFSRGLESFLTDAARVHTDQLRQEAEALFVSGDDAITFVQCDPRMLVLDYTDADKRTIRVYTAEEFLDELAERIEGFDAP